MGICLNQSRARALVIKVIQNNVTLRAVQKDCYVCLLMVTPVPLETGRYATVLMFAYLDAPRSSQSQTAQSSTVAKQCLAIRT